MSTKAKRRKIIKYRDNILSGQIGHPDEVVYSSDHESTNEYVEGQLPSSHNLDMSISNAIHTVTYQTNTTERDDEGVLQHLSETDNRSPDPTDCEDCESESDTTSSDFNILYVE